MSENEVINVQKDAPDEPKHQVPAAWKVHGALLAANIAFGGGSVVGKLGVSGTNPVLFALIREGVAGPLLLAIAAMTRIECPRKEHLLRLLCCGIFIFINQFAFIVALKLTDPTTGSIWQPSQPIFTTMVAWLLGMEELDWKKTLGILCAVSGATVMIVVPGGSGDDDSSSGSDSSSGATHNILVGNLLFFANCLATSLYVICTKPLLAQREYLPISVTAWSYISASVMMAATALIINETQAFLDFVCPPSDCKGAWNVPPAMVLALAYWIIFQSILSYGCMTWANAHAKPSVVSAYTVVQPLTSGLLSVFIIIIAGRHWAVDEKGFEMPGFKDFGAIGILLGLALIISSKTMDEVEPYKVIE